MTDDYRGHVIQVSESGYSYECPTLELSAPTRLELERAIRNVTREERESEPIRYQPGESFTCWKRPFDPDKPMGLGEPCGATIVMHSAFWCSQVCPKCLAIYWAGHSNSANGGRYDVITADFGAWFDAVAKPEIHANIARNGGQYVPTFER